MYLKYQTFTAVIKTSSKTHGDGVTTLVVQLCAAGGELNPEELVKMRCAWLSELTRLCLVS